ncbi:MAG: DNA-3-methyladenine glycosylase family protein [Nocardioidaceae bacterium]
MTSTVPRTRRWQPGWPCAPYDVLRVLRRGSGDPAFRYDAATHTVWRAAMTPAGASTIRVSPRPGLGEIELTAWGSGADWMLEQAPAMLGLYDDVAGFAPRDPRVSQAWQSNPHWRVTRTGLVLEALVAAVIEQKVTGQEAWTGWRRLLYRHGVPAPGPSECDGMRCLPAASVLATVPSWEWLRCQIDPARSRTVVRAARVASGLERTVGLSGAEVERRLCSLPGVGVWTAAEVRQRAHGDADAVSFGDYHVARHVGWALTGRDADDDALAAMLEPERPHRYRVQHIVTTRMRGRPRRGPRMPPRTHLPR